MKIGLARLLTAGALLALLAAPAGASLLRADQILTEDQLRPGMRGYGKTVFHGTRVERFDVTVLGVLEKIDFGANLILIRIDSGPVVSEHLGVVAGMSGSPVYVNGRLIGALAFAFPFAKEPVAGVTPIRQMLEAFEPGSAPGRPAAQVAQGALQPRGGVIRIAGRPYSRAIVAADAVNADPATICLTPIATPVMVSGASREGLRRLDTVLRRHHLTVMSGPGGAAPAEAPPLEPGSAVGAQLISGDLDVTAIGTVTAVIGDQVIAFGHPLMELGAVDIPLTGAYVHAVMPSYEVSSKLASPTRPVGRFTQDRSWCTGGRLGASAGTVPADLSVRDADRNVTRRYRVAVLRQRDLTAQLLFVSALSALTSLGSPLDGTVEYGLSIRAAGMDPLLIRGTYVPPQAASIFSMLFEGDLFSMLPLGDLMRVLDALENNPFGPVAVQAISVEAAVTSARRSAMIERVYADRSNVHPGDAVRVGVVIQPFGEPRTERELTLHIPERAPPGRLRIGVAGGASLRRQEDRLGLRRPEPRTAEEFIRNIADQAAAAELVADVVPGSSGLTLAGRRFDELPSAVASLLLSAPMLGARASAASDRTRVEVPWPLSGAKTISLTVETDEKEKAARPPSGAPSMLFGEDQDLQSFFEGLFQFGGELAGLRLPQAAVPVAADMETGDDEQSSDEAEMPTWSEVEALSEKDLEEITPADLGGETTSERAAGLARGPEIWEQKSEKDFSAGKCFGAAVVSSGAVVRAPQADALWRDTKGLLWCQAQDGQGNLYFGSWGDGAVMRLGGDGKAEVAFQSPDTAITALAFDTRGVLLAAGTPSGTIYRIADATLRSSGAPFPAAPSPPRAGRSPPSLRSTSGTTQPWCRLDDPYVWALAFGADGRLYAATGPRGRVYAVDAEGRAQVALQTPDAHVLALTADRAGVIYCGTWPRGKVYRIGLDGEPSAVFETPDCAVRCLATDRNGNLYVGTSPKGRVYRITPQSGEASVVLDLKAQAISALASDGDAVYAAARQAKARIYRIDSPQSAVMLAELDGVELTSLSADSEHGVTALLAPSSDAVRLAGAAQAEGRFLSSVLDAGGVADWGVIAWETRPAGDASIALRTRSGNTAYPDETWSPWSAACAPGDRVASPAGRYLQYRADFAPRSGALDYVKVFRLDRNQPPEVMVTAPARGSVWSGAKDIGWKASDPDGDTLTFEVYASADGGKTWKRLSLSPHTVGTGIPAPAPAGAQGQGSEQRGAGPGGLEPAGAGLSAPEDAGAPSLQGDPPLGILRDPRGPEGPGTSDDAPRVIEELRKSAQTKGEAAPQAEKAAAEKPPEKELKSKSLSWDTAKEKDGVYRIKVVASDAAANPADPKTAEAVSEAVTLDNTPPVLVLAGARGRLREPEFAYVGRDATSYLAGAEYRVDGGRWIAAAAADRVFDSPEEKILLSPQAVPPGAHTLEIRLRDGAGNDRTFKMRYQRRKG